MTEPGHTDIIFPDCEKEFSEEFGYCTNCGQKNKEQDLKLTDLYNIYRCGRCDQRLEFVNRSL